MKAKIILRNKSVTSLTKQLNSQKYTTILYSSAEIYNFYIVVFLYFIKKPFEFSNTCNIMSKISIVQLIILNFVTKITTITNIELKIKLSFHILLVVVCMKNSSNLRN